MSPSASSTIPDGAEFYMEGVRPGKITLEWRLQKGTIDVKHEQTFKVETRKTVAEWQEEVRYQIRLQTKVKSGAEVDVALYHPGDGFRNANAAQDNVLRVNAIYEYYQQLFKQMPEKFMWAGMAKVAAAPIYAGMSDLNTWWQYVTQKSINLIADVFHQALLHRDVASCVPAAFTR